MIEKSINKKPWKFRSLFYFEMINTCHRLLFSSMKILIPRYNMISENLYYVHTWFIPYSSTHGSMVLHISKGAMAKALMRACGQFPWTLISQVLTPSVVRVSSSTTSAIPIVQQCSNRVKWAKKMKINIYQRLKNVSLKSLLLEYSEYLKLYLFIYFSPLCSAMVYKVPVRPTFLLLYVCGIRCSAKHENEYFSNRLIKKRNTCNIL